MSQGEKEHCSGMFIFQLKWQNNLNWNKWVNIYFERYNQLYTLYTNKKNINFRKMYIYLLPLVLGYAEFLLISSSTRTERIFGKKILESAELRDWLELYSFVMYS